MARVAIGSGEDYDLQAGEIDWALPISRALADGHRWLVLAGGNYGMYSGINLDQWIQAGSSVQGLRLEGAGPHITNVTRHAPVVLFAASGAAEWRLYFDGVKFDGLSAPPWNRRDDLPLCSFQRLRGSLFKNCSFLNSGGGDSPGGTGLEIGTGQPGPGHQRYGHTVIFVNCQMDGNRDSGLRVGNACNFAILTSFIQENARTQFEGGLTRAGLDVEFASTGGSGIILGAHLELNGADGEWGVRLSGQARAVRIANSYFYYSVSRMEAGTTNSIYENNLHVVRPGEPSPLSDVGIGNIVRYNVDVSS
jgi:hypothetical protein